MRIHTYIHIYIIIGKLGRKLYIDYPFPRLAIVESVCAITNRGFEMYKRDAKRNITRHSNPLLYIYTHIHTYPPSLSLGLCVCVCVSLYDFECAIKQ